MTDSEVVYVLVVGGAADGRQVPRRSPIEPWMCWPHLEGESIKHNSYRLVWMTTGGRFTTPKTPIYLLDSMEDHELMPMLTDGYIDGL